MVLLPTCHHDIRMQQSYIVYITPTAVVYVTVSLLIE